MKIETIMAKFGLKAVNCEPHTGGKTVVSAEEQLGMVGINWHETPIGFSILFAQYLDDKYAARFVFSHVFLEVFERAKKKRIKISQSTQKALAIALVCEATSPYGVVCPECDGTGTYKGANRITRKCQSCEDGFIPWDIKTRYATVFSTSKIGYERFEKLAPMYQELVDWLYEENTKAETLLHKQFKHEVMDADLEQVG